MKRTLLWIPVMLIVFVLGVLVRPVLSPTNAVAAPVQQEPLPLEFYLLVNQPAPLWLARIDLADVYLGGVDLSYADIHEATLAGSDLNSANLEGAQFRRADLTIPSPTLDQLAREQARLEQDG